MQISSKSQQASLLSLFLLHIALPLSFYLACYAALKAPLSSLLLSYADDGENLYHAFSLLKGGIPYLDSVNHHFAGYILPFAIVGYFSGASAASLALLSLLTHSLIALGVYLCARTFVATLPALIAGLLSLTAREPWVISLFPLYELNLLMVFIWLAGLQAVRTTKNSMMALLICWLIAGLALTFDQRGLVFIWLPLLATFFSTQDWRQRLCRSVLGVCSYLIFPCAALLWLFQHGALHAWYQQTIIFPTLFRSASFSPTEKFWQILQIHQPLIDQTLYLLLFAIVGLFALIFNRSVVAKFILCAALPVAAIIPLAGGRTFDYYTIPWLPLLSLLAVFPLQLFSTHSLPRRICALLIISLPIILSAAQSFSLYRENPYRNFSDQGEQQLVSYLRQHINRDDSLYVWGYRPAIYIYLQRLSALPFVSRIMIHPDQSVLGEQKRLAHILPGYSEQFMTQLRERSPTYIVLAQSPEDLSSPADTFVREFLNSKYTHVFHSEGENLSKQLWKFDLYRLID